MSSERAPEGYRRRNRWPALLIIGVLFLAGIVTWVVVLKPEPAADNSCNAPGPAPVTSSRAVDTAAGGANTATGPAATASPTADVSTTDTAAASAAATATATSAAAAPTTTLGAVTDMNTLRDTRPADPATILLRVVNASSTPGMAKTVTETLRKAGFDSIQSAGDDPLYPAADLRCWGEIRYSDTGAQAARTLLIVAPCATLIKDDRFDDSVEFAIGALYRDSELSSDQQAQLSQIKQASTPPPVIEGVTQAAPTLAAQLPLPTATCPS